MFELEDCISYLTNRSARELAEILEHRMSGLPVTKLQWMALYYINRNGSMTQRELAEAMAHKDAAVARLLDRMEKDGLIHRTTGTSDRRTKYVSLTDKGKALEKEGSVIAEKFKNDAVAGISDEDLETFKRILSQISAGMQSL